MHPPYTPCELDDHDTCLSCKPLVPDERYWCQHCHRTFLGSEARRDFFGGMQGCAYEGCGASGLRIDIFNVNDPYLTDQDGYDCDDADGYHCRDELLRIDTLKNVDDIARFSDLKLGSIVSILEMRVANPEERHARAPSTIECVTFLCRWPELRLHGYAAHPRCETGTLRIEGLECDLSEVFEEHRLGPLRDAFREFSKTADVIESTDTRLYARWT